MQLGHLRSDARPVGRAGAIENRDLDDLRLASRPVVSVSRNSGSAASHAFAVKGRPHAASSRSWRAMSARHAARTPRRSNQSIAVRVPQIWHVRAGTRPAASSSLGAQADRIGTVGAESYNAVHAWPCQ
ncbi:hypothetical protein DP62_5729 [Burkholderia pseudomallei]|uniref:hypothetical protein n=1 Tax=Burkholderia pseudomallei TaxID=28450 RepID=UPI00050DB83F|nr:hypothetical protein [Burkholderia pseudomallei]KGC96346.1 hypothetical protein DP62_5729 [Burkholderia pseudomallei]